MCAEPYCEPSKAGSYDQYEFRCEKCYEGDYEEENSSRSQTNEEDDLYGHDYESNTGCDDVIKLCPVIVTSVPRLKDMATWNVAIALYNNLNVALILSIKNKYHSDFGCLLYTKVLASSKDLPVSKSTSEEIVKYITVIKCELKRWVSYLYPKIFFNHKSINYVYNFIHHVVWLPTGNIDCKQTARRLITCDRLSSIEKYHILCLYCLQDEIEIVSANLFQKKIVDYVNFNTHPLIFYWNCYFNDTLEKIPVAGAVSISNFMFNHRRVDNWPAKEYFFERLNYDEQIQNVISFIGQYGSKYQQLLLAKLDDSQRLYVFVDRSVEIMRNYTNSINVEEIIRTWNEIRFLVNRDQFVAIFYTLLYRHIDKEILKDMWINVSNDFKEHLLKSNNHQVVATALESLVYNDDFFFILISNAPASIKSSITKEWFFFNTCVELMRHGQLATIDNLLGICFSNEEDVMKFKVQLVSNDFFISFCEQLINDGNVSYLDILLRSFVRTADEIAQFVRDLTKRQFFRARCEALIANRKFTEMDHLLSSFLPQPELMLEFKRDLTRHQFFLTHCDTLIAHNEFTQLDNLLNSFLVQPQLILEFKKNLVVNSKIIKLYCLGCYRTGNVKNLNNFLTTFLPSSADFIIEYKKALILSNDAKNLFLSLIDSEVDFSDIIADSLPPKMVSEYKKELIFTPSAIATFNAHLHSTLLNRLTICIDRYLTSAEDKIELKKRIVGNPVDLILAMFRNYPENVWNLVALWWLENEENVLKFKSTLPMDDVFNELLKESVFITYDPSHRLSKCRFRSSVEFTSLDRFLNWVFQTPAKIREYKLRKIDSYMNLDAVKTLLRKKDDQYLKAIMRWFFQGNTADMDTFMAQNRGRKIVNFL